MFFSAQVDLVEECSETSSRVLSESDHFDAELGQQQGQGFGERMSLLTGVVRGENSTREIGKIKMSSQ